MVYQYFHRALGHPQTSCYFLLTVWNFFLIFPLNMIDVIVIVFYNLKNRTLQVFFHNFDKLCKKFYMGFRGRMKACQTLGVVSRICLCLWPCLIFVKTLGCPQVLGTPHPAWKPVTSKLIQSEVGKILGEERTERKGGKFDISKERCT